MIHTDALLLIFSASEGSSTISNIIEKCRNHLYSLNFSCCVWIFLVVQAVGKEDQVRQALHHTQERLQHLFFKLDISATLYPKQDLLHMRSRTLPLLRTDGLLIKRYQQLQDLLID